MLVWSEAAQLHVDGWATQVNKENGMKKFWEVIRDLFLELWDLFLVILGVFFVIAVLAYVAANVHIYGTVVL